MTEAELKEADDALKDAEEKDLVRQGERTVDNLKRLFAVVFAASFGLAGAAVAEKIRLVVAGTAAFPPFETIAINIEMIVVFAVTAAVFYHQSAKFLDIRYARHPVALAHPWGFALDYGTLVLTAAPFFFMAHALSPAITHEVGYFVFFGAYVVLFTFGLLLLFVQSIRNSRRVREMFRETVSAHEIEREAKQRQFWLIMNSAILLALLLVFAFAGQSASCPPAPKSGDSKWFLYAFGGIALARDAIDYRCSWRFVFPVPKAELAKNYPFPLSVLMRSKHPRWWTALGYLLVGLCVFMVWRLSLWDIPGWLDACR